MTLVASVIVRNELGRYLRESIPALLEFCDEVRVLDDASDDGTYEWLAEQPRVEVLRQDAPTFYEHEGRTRQRLFAWTLEARPSHVLAIDADEFVADPAMVLDAVRDTSVPVWSLTMEEVWELDGDCICIREDGGWRTHEVPILYQLVDGARTADWRIADKALACGREPLAVRRRPSRPCGTEVMHFGWANPHEREQRHQRYVDADGGRFHRSAHLDSILAPPERVKLEGRAWPSALAARRKGITTMATTRRALEAK